MIAVAIIGILSSVAIPSFNGYIQRARESERSANMKALYVGASVYFQREFVVGSGTDAQHLVNCVPSSGITGTVAAGGIGANGCDAPADSGGGAVFQFGAYSDINEDGKWG